jgi:hypothetical protein
LQRNTVALVLAQRGPDPQGRAFVSRCSKAGDAGLIDTGSEGCARFALKALSQSAPADCHAGSRQAE